MSEAEETNTEEVPPKLESRRVLVVCSILFFLAAVQGVILAIEVYEESAKMPSSASGADYLPFVLTEPIAIVMMLAIVPALIGFIVAWRKDRSLFAPIFGICMSVFTIVTGVPFLVAYIEQIVNTVAMFGPMHPVVFLSLLWSFPLSRIIALALYVVVPTIWTLAAFCFRRGLKKTT